MAILVNEFLGILERLAPAALAEDWDNTGLQLGSRGAPVSSVLVSLNVTEAVITEAAAGKYDLILTHHPLIFQPIRSASDDTETGRLVRLAGAAGINVVAAHTNLDSARGGLADIMAGLIGLMQVKPLESAAAGWYKLVTFVPTADLDRVREALFNAGAGAIGNYEHCSYMVEGTGTFLPMEGAQPAIGRVGKDERVAETRLEMVFPSGKSDQVVAALVSSHSYEEPAYDIYPLATRRHDSGPGRIGELSHETGLADFAGRLAELFGMEQARYIGDSGRLVRRVALVPGGGGDYIATSAQAGADAFVSGDFRYHQGIQAQGLELALVEIPHEISESVSLGGWMPRLEKALAGLDVTVALSDAATGFWQAAPRREHVTVSDEQEDGLYTLHVDGGARGNPGPAAIGAVLASPAGRTVETRANFIGEATNNVAEYQALISGVEMALDRDLRRLAIFSDSELIVRQLAGTYKVKNEGLRPYYQQAKSLLARLEEYELKNVPRESNTEADRLVNQALDEAGH